MGMGGGGGGPMGGGMGGGMGMGGGGMGGGAMGGGMAIKNSHFPFVLLRSFFLRTYEWCVKIFQE